MGYEVAVTRQATLIEQLNWLMSVNQIVRLTGSASWSTLSNNTKSAILNSDPFFVGSDIVDLLHETVKTMPDSSFQATTMPADKGIIFLGHPVAMKCHASRHLKSDGFSGLCWSRHPSGDPRFMLTIFLWDKGIDYPSHILEIGYNCKIDQIVREAQAFSDDEHEAAFLTYVCKFFSALLIFMSQTILVEEVAQASRVIRRQAERTSGAAVRPIRVIKLRRTAHSPSEQHNGPDSPVEWSCRWIVSGHWRNQYYRSTGQHNPIYILPYPKGPDTKPLKMPTKVYAVVR